MSRAVPVMRVDSARVVRGRHYFILVDPAQSVYWTWFKMKCPHWARVANKYEAMSKSMMGELMISVSFLPVFSTKENLISWLSEVLGLSRGERNLLYFCVKK